ncbi:hypothetical protein OH77DRAFT_1415159 [Trametes cingulata]|nr:hypothetical protein OH77DRAFT_1415159 [Trametes cingulata]
MSQPISSPVKSQPTTRTEDGSWYVVLGKGQVLKTQERTHVCKGGKFTDPFPIVFKTPTEELADEILQYSEAVKMIKACSTVLERVRLVYLLPAGENILARYINQSTQGLYVVAYGSESAIFLNHKDASRLTHGLLKAIWRKVPCFKHAIAYMVSGGDSEKYVKVEFQELLKAHLEALTCSGRAPKIEEQEHPTLGMPPSSSHPPISMQATPARASHRLMTHSWPAVGARPSSQSPPSPSPLSPLPPLLTEMTFDVSVAEAHITHEFLYQYTRNLHGIKDTHGFPALNTTRVPSCGTRLDMYLQAHGYDIKSKLAVAFACMNFHSMGEFFTFLVISRTSSGFNLITLIMPSGKGDRLTARHEAQNAQRKYVTRLARQPYRNSTMAVKIKKTPAEKKVLAEERAKRCEKMVEALATARNTVTAKAHIMHKEFGLHDESYYQHQILQHSQIMSTQRRSNPWNGYLARELDELNAALPAGVPRYSSSNPEVMARISKQWHAIPKEEKEELVKEILEEMEEAKERKTLAVQNVPVNAFHDVRATTTPLFEELLRLHARTGLEIAVVAARSVRTSSSSTARNIFATSERVCDFFQVALSNPLEDVACSLEAYCLSGVDGLVTRSADVIADLQSRVASVITQKLGQITHQTVHKMFYVGFAEQITAKFGVVIENWPLTKFSAPSTLRTRLELNTLLNAWETNTTRFRKLTKPEWERWQKQQQGGTSTAGSASQGAAAGSKDGEVIHAVSLTSFVTPPPTHTSLTSSTSALATHDPSTGMHAGEHENVQPFMASPTLLMLSVIGQEAGAVGAPGSVVPDMPVSKPHKRRSDHGKSHKKRKGDSGEALPRDSQHPSASATELTTSGVVSMAAGGADTTPSLASPVAASPAIPTPSPLPCRRHCRTPACIPRPPRPSRPPVTRLLKLRRRRSRTPTNSVRTGSLRRENDYAGSPTTSASLRLMRNEEIVYYAASFRTSANSTRPRGNVKIGTPKCESKHFALPQTLQTLGLGAVFIRNFRVRIVDRLAHSAYSLQHFL